MCTKIYRSKRGLRLITLNTTESFHPTTDWMPCPGVGAKIRYNLMMQAEVGTMQVRPGYQLATVRPDEPELPAKVGSQIGDPGWHTVIHPAPDISSSFFWRFGIFYDRAVSGTTEADVALDVAIEERGRVLGKERIQIYPYNDNTEVAVHPLTGWFSGVDAEHVKAAIVVSNNSTSGTVNQLYARHAEDVMKPGTWTALEGGFNTPSPATGSSERNTGELLLSTGDNFWTQLGLGVKKSAGGDAPSQCTFHVATASTGG